VAVGADGEIKGFAGGGAARDDDVTGAGEVFAIYLLAEHWGTGIGRRLMEAVTESLVEAGFKEAVLWVLEGNARARRFDEAAGWLRDGAAKDDERDCFNLSEVRLPLSHDPDAAHGPYQPDRDPDDAGGPHQDRVQHP
jgi:RimJ/RimL family protein N-acetyltransferase